MNKIVKDIRDLQCKKNEFFMLALISKLEKLEGIEKYDFNTHVLFKFPNSKVETFIKYTDTYTLEDLISESEGLSLKSWSDGGEEMKTEELKDGGEEMKTEELTDNNTQNPIYLQDKSKSPVDINLQDNSETPIDLEEIEKETALESTIEESEESDESVIDSNIGESLETIGESLETIDAFESEEIEPIESGESEKIESDESNESEKIESVEGQETLESVDRVEGFEGAGVIKAFESVETSTIGLTIAKTGKKYFFSRHITAIAYLFAEISAKDSDISKKGISKKGKNGKKVDNAELAEKFNKSIVKRVSRLSHGYDGIKIGVMFKRTMYVCVHESAADIPVLKDFEAFKKELNLVSRSFVTMGGGLLREK